MKTLVAFLLLFLSASHAFAQEPVWSKKYHTGSVTCLDFSGDGGMLISGSPTLMILINAINGDSSKRYFDTLKNPISDKNIITSLDFHPHKSLFIGSNVYASHFGVRYFAADTAHDTLNQMEYPAFRIVSKDPVYRYKSINGNSPGFTQLFWINDTAYISYLSAHFRNTSDGGKYHESYNSIIGLFNLRSELIRMVSDEVPWSNNMIPSPSRQYFFLTQGRIIQIANKEHRDTIYITNSSNTAAFSSNDSVIILAEKNNELSVFTISGKYLEKFSTPTSLTTALATDLKNRYYISAHADSTLRLWTPGIPNIFKKILLKSPVTTIAVSPDSVHFATAHTDGTVALWNIDSLGNSAATDTVFTSVAQEIPFKNTTLSAEPNPFKNSTTIRFSLEKSLKIKLAVTDILGREVAVVKDGISETGEQEIIFKNDGLPQGMYYITLSGDGLLKTIPVQIMQ